ncbi:MAG TPA: glycosyltransferase [Mariniphaga sp.]|nr:glycosyltransferase [Mariniphaga sp.]
MLSINIPVYNIKVTDLVKELSKQALTEGIDYEIRVYDDCSDEEIKAHNRQLSQIDRVIYREMPLNLGRSSLRNKMGSDSSKQYLLFIDADSEIGSHLYLKNYIKNALPGGILCGGTSYSKEKPIDPKKLLRWIYGTNREAIPADKRNNHKGFIITSNNFLIDKQLFLKVHFREDLGPYGHEDTLLGYDLHKIGITPIHIENPVIHTGLEDAEAFLRKSEKALENLKLITEELIDDPNDFINQVRFLNCYNRLVSFIPESLLRFMFSIVQVPIEMNLKSMKPRLLLFDIYKAGYFSILSHG